MGAKLPIRYFIGRGNVVIKIINNNDSEEKRNLSAFTNANHTDGNSNITISGFKIVVSPTVEYGTSGNAGVIKLVNVKNCRVEKVHITCDQTSGYGVFPGDPAQTEEQLYPASAIRFESNKTVADGGADHCTDNLITQCVITEFGKSVGNSLAGNRYGIGVLISRGNRNRVVCCHIRRAKMCCMVEQGELRQAC